MHGSLRMCSSHADLDVGVNKEGRESTQFHEIHRGQQ